MIELLARCPYENPHPIAPGDKTAAGRLIKAGLMERDPTGDGYRSTDSGRELTQRYRELGWLS